VAVQFNLLPDVKAQYVKAQRSKSLITSVAILVSAVAIGIFVVMFLSVSVVQKKILSDADGAIERYTKELKDIPNIEEILTIQNQLDSLSGLHQNKHISSRLFSYLPQVTPAEVKISRVNLDFLSNTMVIDGTAPSQIAINTFIDTLKFTTFKVGDQDQGWAFPSVTESSFSINAGQVSYGISLTFDPKLFANNLTDGNGAIQTPILVVPQTVTTHAGDPANPLFNSQGGEQ